MSSTDETVLSGSTSLYVDDARVISAYSARHRYREEEQRPPAVLNVEGIVDIHCHASQGQQDATALARLASLSGMGGILYKTVAGEGSAKSDLTAPATRVRQIEAELAPWCEAQGVTPTKLRAGWGVARGVKGDPSPEEARKQLEDGIRAIWMPAANSAHTYYKIGVFTHGPTPKDPGQQSDPLSWEEALKVGHYLLDDKGNLKPTVKEVLQLIADFDVAFSFGHATHQEIFALANEVDRLGITRAFVDHPMSPFVNLSREEMKELTTAGIYMNFTFDEISPLLGVDPEIMCRTIQALDLNRVTLSSDVGDPLFPNSVEALRLLRGHMKAYGLTDEQTDQISIDNPARVMGI